MANMTVKASLENIKKSFKKAAITGAMAFTLTSCANPVPQQPVATEPVPIEQESDIIVSEVVTEPVKVEPQYSAEKLINDPENFFKDLEQNYSSEFEYRAEVSQIMNVMIDVPTLEKIESICGKIEEPTEYKLIKGENYFIQKIYSDNQIAINYYLYSDKEFKEPLFYSSYHIISADDIEYLAQATDYHLGGECSAESLAVYAEHAYINNGVIKKTDANGNNLLVDYEKVAVLKGHENSNLLSETYNLQYTITNALPRATLCDKELFTIRDINIINTDTTREYYDANTNELLDSYQITKEDNTVTYSNFNKDNNAQQYRVLRTYGENTYGIRDIQLLDEMTVDITTISSYPDSELTDPNLCFLCGYNNLYNCYGGLLCIGHDYYRVSGLDYEGMIADYEKGNFEGTDEIMNKSYELVHKEVVQTEVLGK